MKTGTTNIHQNGKAAHNHTGSIQPSLINIFALLNEQRVRYALLRGFDELSENPPIKEIDLLVHPLDLPAFEKIVRTSAFIKLPRLGYAPHHFYVNFDRASGIWLKLDVVTDLFSGKPVRHLRWPVGGDFLFRREQRAPLFTLSPADELVSLFLHNLLDKQSFRTERLARIQSLIAEIETQPDMQHQVVQLLQNALGNALDWEQLRLFIGEIAEKNIRSEAKRIGAALNRHKPVGNFFRKITTPLLKKLRLLAFATRHRGIWVALLAPDGGGKSTLSQSLLKQPFLRGKIVYMGINVDASTVGLPTTKLLKNIIKNMASAKRPKLLILPVKALASLNKLLEHWLRVGAGFAYSLNGRTVIFDRFIYDSYLAGAPKRLKSKLRRLLFWGTCPHADLTIFLDAPGELLFRRKGEHSPEALERQRQKYLGIADQIPNFHAVDATQSPEDVQLAVLELIWQTYQKQRNG